STPFLFIPLFTLSPLATTMKESWLSLWQENNTITSATALLEEGGNLLIEGMEEPIKASLIAYAAAKSAKTVLIVTGLIAEENRLLFDLPFFTETPLFDYPSWETVPHERVSPSPDIVGERYRILHQLRHSKERSILIAPLQALLQKVISP